MATKQELIRNKAVELLKDNPQGLRYSELMRELAKYFDMSLDTVSNAAWNIHDTRSEKVHKPARGLFKYRFTGEEEISEIEKPPSIPREEDFYEPFADYLQNELNECTKAIALGGNILKKRWGTPDVIGINKSSHRDVIQFQTEIVSAEIKTDPLDPVTAFGQAIAYRLFSSKVYLVEPNAMSEEDKYRIEALCILFGIGLILFELNAKTPNFQIRVRAQSYNPDMFYVNQFANTLHDTKEEFYKELFGY